MSGGAHFGGGAAALGGGGAAYGLGAVAGGAVGVGVAGAGHGGHLHGAGGGAVHGGAGGALAGHLAGGVAAGHGPIGGGAAVGCGAGCAEGCAVATGPAAMTFVGPGAGQYTTEVSYKFVGAGGEFSLVTPKRSYLCLVTSSVGLLVVLVLVLVFTNVPTTTTTPPPTTTWTYPPVDPVTTTPRPPVIGTCTCWGDPHFVTFDGARPSFYGEGEFWIVKSPQIKIQGRYLGTAYTHGLSATNKVVVGGDFLRGHTIAVGTIESGELLVDGRPVLGTFPSTYSLGNDLGTLIYNAEGELPDKAAAKFDRRILHMLLPMGVSITVFRWNNYMDLRIQMPQQAGQDGSCGNFNGNPNDDTTDQIFARIGARVPYSDLIFRHQQDVRVSGEMERMIAADCPQRTLDQAKAKCTGELSAPNARDMDSCVFDFCFGMNEHALRTAQTYG